MVPLNGHKKTFSKILCKKFRKLCRKSFKKVGKRQTFSVTRQRQLGKDYKKMRTVEDYQKQKFKRF